MRVASRIIIAFPAVGVALDVALCHAPRYVAAALLAPCLFVLARRAYDWWRTPGDCPAGRAIRSALVAALAGAPFFFLLAVAAVNKP